MTKQVRVRFAPSPTGALHIGGVRTALYNYLFARKNKGTFILRIEDTDSTRFVSGAEKYIIEALKWCNIQIDEGIGIGGPHSPYRQSERKDIYKKYALQLVEKGYAYYAFDSTKEIQKLRLDAQAKKETFAYNFSVRNKLKTSLNFSEQETQQRIQKGEQYVIRFKMPENKIVEMNDLIRGHVSINTSTLDDKVLFKSADGLPTYHLANIVDDYLMNISHVIRGEEWLPSLPLHYLLYEALGFEKDMPLFAHLPLLLKPQGQGKLSKRDGDKFGFPVFPLEWKTEKGTTMGYREEGYLPEAFINMLALLGWNPGTEQEIFSMDELIDSFSLEKVSNSGARFNPDKAKWFNAQYIRKSSNSFLAEYLKPILEEKGIKESDERIEKAISLIKERLTFPCELWEMTKYMFVTPESYDSKSIKKFWKKENIENLKVLATKLNTKEEIIANALEQDIYNWVKDNNLSMGKIMNTLRLTIIGTSQGPSILDICEFIGKQETLKRINNAIEKIGH